MLPRKTPNWFLVVLWLGSLVPYLLIKLWLVKLPPLFNGAGVVADVTANSLLAFFTAFPFWWAVEWFSRRSERFHRASLQERFIKQAVHAFEVYVADLHRGFNLNANDREPIEDSIRDLESLGSGLDRMRQCMTDGELHYACGRGTRDVIKLGAFLQRRIEMLDRYSEGFTSSFTERCVDLSDAILYMIHWAEENQRQHDRPYFHFIILNHLTGVRFVQFRLLEVMKQYGLDNGVEMNIPILDYGSFEDDVLDEFKLWQTRRK